MKLHCPIHSGRSRQYRAVLTTAHSMYLVHPVHRLTDFENRKLREKWMLETIFVFQYFSRFQEELGGR